MRRYSHAVTPASNFPQLTDLCRELAGAGVMPEYVHSQPLEDMPSKECFPIVESHVGVHGGEMVIGWVFWEMPGQYVEAEFHAVWKQPDGSLLDIAPRDEPTQCVLFLPDPLRSYEGRQVNNQRRLIRNDPVIAEFFAACDQEFEFTNRGERAGQHGALLLEGDDATEFMRIQQRKMGLFIQLQNTRPLMGPYSPCWCGSGKKIRWCHNDA